MLFQCLNLIVFRFRQQTIYYFLLDMSCKNIHQCIFKNKGHCNQSCHSPLDTHHWNQSLVVSSSHGICVPIPVVVGALLLTLTTIFHHHWLPSAALWVLLKPKSVHYLILSSHIFLWLSLFLRTLQEDLRYMPFHLLFAYLILMLMMWKRKKNNMRGAQ